MPRFVARRIKHKLDDLISFCVSAVVLAAARILQKSWRFLFEFILLQDLPACLKCHTNKMILLQTCVALYRPVSTVAKRTLSVRDVWPSIPGPIKSALCRQRLATVATFVRSCVAQALSRGDGLRHSLHAWAQYDEYNEDLIFCAALSLYT